MMELKIDAMGADAFVDDPNAEVARILRHVADQVEAGDAGGGVLFDYNGARVGSWTLQP